MWKRRRMPWERSVERWDCLFLLLGCFRRWTWLRRSGSWFSGRAQHLALSGMESQVMEIASAFINHRVENDLIDPLRQQLLVIRPHVGGVSTELIYRQKNRPWPGPFPMRPSAVRNCGEGCSLLNRVGTLAIKTRQGT